MIQRNEKLCKLNWKFLYRKYSLYFKIIKEKRQHSMWRKESLNSINFKLCTENAFTIEKRIENFNKFIHCVQLSSAYEILLPLNNFISLFFASILAVHWIHIFKDENIVGIIFYSFFENFPVYKTHPNIETEQLSTASREVYFVLLEEWISFHQCMHSV